MDGGHFVPGSQERGCWYPKSFDKAVVIIIDALRYDFTVPFILRPNDAVPHYFHDTFSVLYETSVKEPHNAFLRPFIADPPTTTLQRLKALTTGNLPTFIEAGSNFAGTAIDEDNLVEQLYKHGQRVVHLGDDTWHSLFPGYFEPNLTRAYDSFNVPDLHTVDNGVNEHVFPLLEPAMRDRWDVIFGHYLGVDHTGHSFGPDHPEMAAKLRQMDGVIRRMIEMLDDSTLLVVMGDHGMDGQGNHGGESDDEVEAALWMYSKRGIFGHREPSFAKPPATAKERPVTQIDLVATLSFLLGLPVPFNNLGNPIEEAFIGKKPNYKALATVGALTSAQIHRYQAEYAAARNLDNSTTTEAETLWQNANVAWSALGSGSASNEQHAYEAFEAYQSENLRACKRIWARFDLISMSMGIVTLVGTFALITIYAQGIAGDSAALTPPLLGRGVLGTAVGAIIAATVPKLLQNPATLQLILFGAAMGGIGSILFGLLPARHILKIPVPTTFWGGLCALVTLLLCVGFASNSFTIWEEEQLLFLLSTFGLLMLGSSLGQKSAQDQMLGAANAISFLLATRLSSLSRLCREEQMPNCKPTYFASANSSTSANWQLAIPFVVAFLLPTIIKHYYMRTKNYQGSAVIWIGIALRLGLVMTAVSWAFEAAYKGNWYPEVEKETLKSARVIIAQVVLALAFGAGYSTYIWASPMLLVKTEATNGTPNATSKPLDDTDPTSPVLTTVNGSPKPRSKLIILGYANTHGTRYFLLPCAWLLALLLVQEPMGQGALALCAVSILNLLEIIDANNLRHSSLGPIVLALLGSYYFFKTGHQAALVTIQWDTGFIALKTLKYPWSPILIVLNTLGPQILCAIAVPAIAMWKVPPKRPGLLGRVAQSMATHILFYAAITLATVVESAWLRRHLMLYRVFMPRMLLSIVSLLLVELIAALVAIGGVRWSIVSVGDVFGWPS